MKDIYIAALVTLILGFIYGVAHTTKLLNIVPMVCIILALVFICYKLIKNG